MEYETGGRDSVFVSRKVLDKGKCQKNGIGSLTSRHGDQVLLVWPLSIQYRSCRGDLSGKKLFTISWEATKSKSRHMHNCNVSFPSKPS